MVKINVKCPNCKKIEISRYGKQENGAQKYKCNNQECSRVTFILEYKKRGFLKEVRDKVVGMALNGSGIRATGRVLGISKICFSKSQKMHDLVIGLFINRYEFKTV